MNKVLVAFLLLACTIFVFIQMRPTGNKLKTAQTKVGILNLEFAYNSYHTTRVLNAWKADERIAAAKTNTYIDFAFIFFYAVFLFYSCKAVSGNFSGKFFRVGMSLSKAAVVAGALDVMENAGMLFTLSGNSSTVVSALTAVCALLKWLLVVSAVLYLVVISALSLYLFTRHKKAAGPK